MTSLQNYGLTPAGFVPKSLQQVQTELVATVQGSYGQNINCGAETVFGQLIGIFAEREALLWQLAQAVYQSQFPGGAEGISVDNILSLTNLTRLPATATVTNPTPNTQTNGVTLYGLVLTGTAGTVVPKGAIITTNANPPTPFALDQTVTLAPAVNAVQSLVLSTAPTSGTFQLSLTESSGTVLTTSALAYNALPNTMQLWWATPPTAGTFRLMMALDMTAVLPYNVTAAALQAALIAALGSAYTGLGVTGSTTTGFLITYAPGTFNHSIRLNCPTVSFASAPTSGTFTLAVAGTPIAPLAYNATAAQMQAALVAAGYPLAKVLLLSGVYYINWVAGASAAVTVSAFTTPTTPLIGSNNQLTAGAPGFIQSMQYSIANPTDTATGVRPFTDILVSGTGTTFTLTFGGSQALPGQPSSGAQPQPLVTVAQNSLFAGGTQVNVSTSIATQGAPAQTPATATATATGPVTARAGTLTVIGSPVSGWAGVTNQLDALPGQNVETDTAAMVRRTTLLNSQANGPLQSIVQKVSALAGVTQVTGFQNTTDTALQMLTVAAVPTSGSFQLGLNGGTTAALPFSATAVTVQQAMQAVPGYVAALVSGSMASGFQIDFNGAQGGQPQPLINVLSNTTGVGITVGFGRAPKSYEIVVQGGSSASIAQVIYQTAPAGVSSYGTPTAVTTGSVTVATATLSVAASAGVLPGQSVYGPGVAYGTSVAAVAGTAITLSQPALSTAAGTYTFNNTVIVYDAYGNPVLISFSRPVPVLFYVTIQLVTDTYRTPGVPASGLNPSAKFTTASIPTIQAEVAALGNMVPVGGTVVAYGTSGLYGAFNNIAGIVSYTLTFGAAPSPSQSSNIQLLTAQSASFQTANISVSWS